LANTAANALRALARKLRTQRRRARENHFQARQIIFLDDGILGQLQHDWRHNVRERYAILLNQAEKLFQIESWHRHNRRAQMQTHIEHDHESVNVKERQHTKERIVAMKVVEPIHLAHIRHQIVVSEHYALWQTGCAARIRQRYQVFSRINRHRWDIAIAF